MGFLKLLELENFKSYKGRQVVGPFVKFTAIIGPNGSGKSNLMDAISFVLGERTQNLRVRNLKDLIHGAPIGKPVASRAKVVAVYQEDDGTETSFARIIVGTGSDYKLNGKTVPYSEYHARLESIGVFIKAKNCLVFQGAVESIAMKTPKERTQLFEEISGSGEFSSDYDKKKVAMQHAQGETTMSYNKKKGIVSEKKEAKAEKEEAERYQKLEEEFEEARLEEQMFNLYHSERRIGVTTEEIRGKQKELDRMMSRRSKLESQLKSKKQESAKWTREVAVLEKKMREKEVEINRTKPLYIQAKEKTSHVSKRLEANKKAHKKAQEKEKQHQEQIESLETELEDVRLRSQQYDREIAQSRGKDLKLMESQVKEYHRLRGKVGSKTAPLTQDIERMEREEGTALESLAATKAKQAALLRKKEGEMFKRGQHEQRLESLNSYQSTNTQTIDKLKRTSEKLSSDITQADNRYDEITDALAKVVNELHELAVDKHETKRSQRQAETLENLKRLYPGVYGKFSELCQPNHPRYAMAVVKVLSVNMDSIVVDQEKTAKECIQYLKEQHIEPMTFIPLDGVVVKPINESYRQLGGTTKLVIDVIKYDTSVSKAMLYACGSAIVCDGMDEARRVAFHTGDRKKVVSLDGTLFKKNGVISGGLSDLKNRAKAFDEKKVDNLNRKKMRMAKELAEVKEVQRNRNDLSLMEAELKQLETRFMRTKHDRDMLVEHVLPENQREIDTLDRELQAVEPELNDIQASVDELSARKAEVQAKINKIADKVFAEFCKSIGVANIRQFEEKQLKGQEIQEQKKLEFNNLQSRLQNQLAFERRKDPTVTVRKHARTIRDDESSIVALKEDEQEKLEAIEALEEEVQELQEQRQKIKEEFDQKDVQMNELRKMLSGEIRGITQLQKKINTLETELDQRKADRHSLLKGCKMDDIKVPMEHGTMDDIGDEGPSMSSQSEATLGSSTALMDIDSMSSQGARVLYERESRIVIDYSQLDRKLKQIVDADEIRKMAHDLNGQVVRLQSTLDRFNAPNMRALEKLEGVEARLHETSEAFEQSRHLSKKTKTEFEHVKKLRLQKFSDALDHVAGEIDQIYKKLSNNSSAQAFISADNAEEPYLDGISYNCIAPGKRFRPMDNLSGGEKTVAALALLFAIHGYQSAPFFVLDEIDAALDNTNINRVANYIMEKTHGGSGESFQCIVISLKEEFYCHADALIGIYSEVGGECTVSQTVTHDLTQYPITSGASPVKARPH